jgi:hypothetical protein
MEEYRIQILKEITFDRMVWKGRQNGVAIIV